MQGGAYVPSRSASDYIDEIRAPLHGLLVEYHLTLCPDPAADGSSLPSDLRELFQTVLNILHGQKKQGDRKARNRNLAARRTLEWLAHLFNIHAHDHAIPRETLAQAMASALAIFSTETIGFESPHRRDLEALARQFSGVPTPKPGPNIEAPATEAPGAAPRTAPPAGPRAPAEVRGELLQIKRDIEDHYTRDRPRMEPWEHVLQNARLDDLIRAKPKTQEALRAWVRKLKSYPLNRTIMEDQVKRFGGEILEALNSDPIPF